MSNREPSLFLPYGRQSISEADISAVVDVLRSPYLTQGPVVPAFEHAVSSKVNARFGVAVNSATSALHIACLALGLGPGDWVWTSPTTFVASANCGLYCGSKVDFVDIDPMTGLISIVELRHKLEKAEKEGNLPKVLIPVHLTGSSCDMESISQLADRYGFDVLEDASHAIGGKYSNQPVGCCLHSKICVFSFHPVKIITTGEGGMATTNDPELAQRMADLRSHGIVKDSSRFQQRPVGPWSYEQQELGFNYRLSDINAALGLSQLNRLDEFVAERNQKYQYYEELIKELPIGLLKIPTEVFSSVHLAVIRLNIKEPEYHLEVFNGLRAAGVGVQLHYSPVHLQPFYRLMGFSEGCFPESEAYACNAISLPVHPGLQRHDQEYVVRALSGLLK